MSRHWGIDVSHGVSLSGYWPDMVTNKLSFAIFRAGQGMGGAGQVDAVTPQALQAIAAGVPFALYWPVHPWKPAEDQVDRFLEIAKGYSAKSLMLDFELYEDVASQTINDVYYKAYNYLKGKTALPVVNYSGWWFVEGHCPQMKDWISKDVYWEANYKQYFYPDSWVEFAQQLADLYVPKYAGYPPVGVFQFAGDRPTSMVPSTIDYNLIDNDEVFAYLFLDGPRPVYLSAGSGGGPGPVVLPSGVAHYKVSNASGTYIQAGPSWQAGMVKYLQHGDDVFVDTSYTLTPGWYRVEAGGYVAANRVALAS